jgi:lysozyme family protein
MSKWFDIGYQFVRGVEGKYSNDKDDRGGETQYGISTPTFIDAKKKD